MNSGTVNNDVYAKIAKHINTIVEEGKPGLFLPENQSVLWRYWLTPKHNVKLSSRS
jgi:hypothetical protein